MSLVSILLASLVQDDSVRAQVLLEETAATLKGAPALSFERSSTQRSANSKEPYGQNLSKISLKRPNRMRQESASKDQDGATLLDGTNLWSLDREKNEYVKHPQRGGWEDYWLRNDPLNALYFGATVAKILEGAREVRIRSEKESGTVYDVIRWKAALPSERAKTADFTLWLGPDRLPRRFISSDSPSPAVRWPPRGGEGGATECCRAPLRRAWPPARVPGRCNRSPSARFSSRAAEAPRPRCTRRVTP
jgi:outer membrane lipoprotein-sorting protein